MQMPKMLTDEQIETFRRDGCVFPIRAMSADAAFAIRPGWKRSKQVAAGTAAGQPAPQERPAFPVVTTCHHRESSMRSKIFMARSAVLDHHFFIQGEAGSGFVSAQDSDYWG